jgi:hypothetical protein
MSVEIGTRKVIKVVELVGVSPISGAMRPGTPWPRPAG